MEEDHDEDEDEDEDEGMDEDEDVEEDLPSEDDDDLDYYSDSEAAAEEVDVGGVREDDDSALREHVEPRERFFRAHEHVVAGKSVPTRPSASPDGPSGPESPAGEDAPAARHKREIAGVSEGGVPVLSESYAGPLPTSANASEGLRLYGVLAAAQAGDPTTASPYAKVYRERPAWGAKRPSRKEHRDTAAAAQRRALPLVAASASAAAGGSATDPSAPGVITRESRVMQTVTAAPRTHARPAPRLLFHTAARSTEVRPVQGEVIVRSFSGEGGRAGGAALRSASGHRLKKKSPMKKTLSSLSLREAPEEGASGARGHGMRRRPAYAAHYGGDASAYSLSSEHYEGNGRLRHPNGVFSDWSASSWMSELNMDRKFSLRAGEVTVTDVGLYFVYAQIYYLDEHDTNGFRVLVNGRPVLQCTVTAGHTGSGPRNYKSNTCFTAGAVYLASGDRVSVRELGNLRWTVFEPEKSFFGLVKLGHTSRIA